MIRNQIRALRKEGKTYQQIADIVGCSKSMVCYYCSDEQKEKTAKRCKRYKARNPLIKKLDNFNSSFKKKGFYNKVVHFQRNGKDEPLTMEMIIARCGGKSETVCYLTGDRIDLSQPHTYSFDHIVPVIKGGPNTLENLGICTTEVNMAKSAKTPEEFIELCKKVLVHNGYSVTKLAPTLGD
jgi:transcriptional regulator with XRE-family HTH domain